MPVLKEQSNQKAGRSLQTWNILRKHSRITQSPWRESILSYTLPSGQHLTLSQSVPTKRLRRNITMKQSKIHKPYACIQMDQGLKTRSVRQYTAWNFPKQSKDRKSVV